MKEKRLVEKLHGLTMKLVNELHKVTYEELLEFTEQREKIVLSLEASNFVLDESQKKLILQIQSYDHTILKRMEFFKKEASDWLLRQGQIKNQQAAYQQGYSIDSLFIDNKK